MKSLPLLLILVLAWSCTSTPEQAQQQSLSVHVVPVISQNVNLEQEFVGHVYGKVDIPIRARVDGYLQGIHFNEGRPLKKGDLLYTIDPEPFQAQVAEAESRLAEAKIEAVRANNDLQRYEPLVKIDAVSKSDYDAAVAAKGAADAAVEAAKANVRSAKINLGYTTIYSPIDGLIGKTKAKVGEYVGRNPNPVILNTVSRIDTVRVEFYITEDDYLQLAREFSRRKESGKAENPKNDLFRLVLSDGSLFEEIGHFDFIDRGVEAGTGSILIQTSFPNPKGLIRPGQFARVRAVMNTVENGLLVPQRCVTEFQGNFFVMKLGPENTIVQQRIEIASSYNDYYLVASGLQAGDRVVIDGLQKVQNGMVISPVDTVFQSKYSQQL